MRKFDCILLLFLVTASVVNAFTSEEVEERDRISKECRDMSGATVDDIFNIRHGRFDNTPVVKNQLLCFYKKFNMVNEQDQLNVDELKARISKFTEDAFEVDNIVNKCEVGAKDATRDETYTALKCVIQETRKMTMAKLIGA